MSNDRSERLNKFKQKYAFEYSLMFEIAATFDEMCASFYTGSEEDYPRTIKFTVTLNELTKKPSLLIQPDGMIFLTAIIRVVMRNIMSSIDPKALSELERRAQKRVEQLIKQRFMCQNCGYENEHSADYCEKCGERLVK